MMEKILEIGIGCLLCATMTGCLPGVATEIEPSDYDRSCATAADCEIVYGDGDVCLCPGPMAIHESEVDDFRADYDRKFDRCTAVADCAPLPYDPVAACQSGTCVVERSEPDAGTGGDAGSDMGL